MHLQKIYKFLTAPFQFEGGYDKPLVAVFLLINALVFFNGIFRDPRSGYDTNDHVKYIRALAEFHLPLQEKTREFFSPPLPYLLPALFLALFKGAGSGGEILALKLGQVINGVYSLGLTFFVLKLCRSIYPDRRTLAVSALGLLGMLPVYHKTFSMLRGEPLLTFWS